MFSQNKINYQKVCPHFVTCASSSISKQTGLYKNQQMMNTINIRQCLKYHKNSKFKSLSEPSIPLSIFRFLEVFCMISICFFFVRTTPAKYTLTKLSCKDCASIGATLKYAGRQLFLDSQQDNKESKHFNERFLRARIFYDFHNNKEFISYCHL